MTDIFGTAPLKGQVKIAADAEAPTSSLLRNWGRRLGTTVA